MKKNEKEPEVIQEAAVTAAQIPAQPEKPIYPTIKELAEAAELPEEVYEGVKAANGWKEGKSVTEKEFDEAVKKFLKAPADGRKETK